MGGLSSARSSRLAIPSLELDWNEYLYQIDLKGFEISPPGYPLTLIHPLQRPISVSEMIIRAQISSNFQQNESVIVIIFSTLIALHLSLQSQKVNQLAWVISRGQIHHVPEMFNVP